MAMQNIIPGFVSTLKRFPVAALASLLAWAYGESLVADSWSDAGWMNMWSLLAAFVAAGAGHLWAESRGFSKTNNLIVALACGGLAGLIMFFHMGLHTSPWYFFAALILGLMLAPHLRKEAAQGAIWLFNLRLGLAVLLSGVVVLVVALGLIAVLNGLDFLLGISMPSSLSERVVLFASLLVGPLFGLSLMPVDLDESVNLEDHRGTLVERGVSVLVNWILAPLALVYALILHAYAAKIMALWNLPKGEIGWIVTLFAIGGTATWLIAWPWRASGNRLLRWFMAVWFWCLPVPVVLLGIAIWRRISDYGVTPDRYGIAMVALWAAIVFLYLALRRNRADMRLLIGSAALLFLVASFGPQGAMSRTIASQMNLLQSSLEKAGLLKDGVVTGKKGVATDPQMTAASSMVSSIVRAGGADKLMQWLPPEQRKSTIGRDYTTEALLQSGLGLNAYVPSAEFTDHYYFYGGGIRGFRVPGGGTFAGAFNLSNYATRNSADGFVAAIDSETLTITAGSTIARLPLRDLMQKIKDADASAAQKNLPVEIAVSDKVKLYVTGANFDYSASAIQVGNLGFWLVVLD